MSLTTLDEHQRVWDYVCDWRAKREKARLAAPLVRLWDGDYRLRGEVVGERKGSFEFIENDVGTATLELPIDHYLAKWVMDHKGRFKRNVHVTFDKQGARWSGCMDNYRVVRKDGDAYVEILFKHDFEHAKHILVWANPFLRPEFQFPKLWIIFGPAKWCLLTTLFVNIMRLETSLWTLPDNPLDIGEWMGPSFWPGNWRMMVKPCPILLDNSTLHIVFSRFKPFYEVAKTILDDSQLSLTCRRYLKDEDPHPFSELSGEYAGTFLEDIGALVPLRHGCLVWDIVDRSGWGGETAFGGSLLTGLIRTFVQYTSDGLTEGVNVYTGDPTFPGDYFMPWYAGTNPRAPWVVFEEGLYTGIKESEFIYYEATDTSVVMGGKSMPGVNEAISTAVNMAGDFLTSLINTQISLAATISGGWGVNVSAPAVDIPPLGGVMDAVAKIFYEDVILAFMEFPSMRAASLPMAFSGLENAPTSLGDFHYYEGWADGADRAFTISALAAARQKFWETRTRHAMTLKISDAAPYYIGDNGKGDFWLGDRVAHTVFGYPVEDTLFVERVMKLKYDWGKDGPSGWVMDIGGREPADPVIKSFEMIRSINGAISQLGVW